MIAVVKVGGTAPGAAAQVAALAATGREVVVVHGAGPQISAGCIAAGLEPRFVDGQRVTDDSVMRVVEATVAEANAAMCAELQFQGVDCRPMRDALTAEPWGDSRLGLVGRITSVEQIGVRALLAGGIVPVMAPTASGLNVNADNAAATVAGALGASELIFLSDVPGLMGPGGEVIRRVTAASAARLVASGSITGGMIPKLDAGFAALAGGVRRVRIGAETMVTA
ncbi:MAG TPA: acetylglutamate kinase [Gaiellales bacterium]|nr:acetylglutamate kinase [Gaiellales bacterium]